MLVLWASLSTLCTVLWINCPTASFGPFGRPQADRPGVSTTRFGVSACQCLRLLVRILRGNLIRCQLRSARRELCYMPLLDAGALLISNGISKTWCSTPRAFTVYTSCISIDIVIDLHYGDLGNREVQEFWLEGIRRRWVHSFLGGPPCCIWSRARSVALQTRHGSHPVRSADCGVSHHLHCVSWSLMARSCLASAGLRSVNSLQGRAGVLEQPAEPEQSSAPSIWKLPAV